MKKHLNLQKVCLTLTVSLSFVLLAVAQTPTKATASSGKTTYKPSPLLGSWEGSFTGSASGTCELRFLQTGDSKPTGQISLYPEGGEKSPLVAQESVTLEGSHVQASFTDAQGSKIEFDGTLENDLLKGERQLEVIR